MRSTSLNSQPVQVAAPMVTRSMVPVVIWLVLSAIVTSVAGFLLLLHPNVSIVGVCILFCDARIRIVKKHDSATEPSELCAADVVQHFEHPLSLIEVFLSGLIDLTDSFFHFLFPFRPVACPFVVLYGYILLYCRPYIN